ncbi:glycosyltransferase [Shewanella sp. MEBiC00475]|uniref:glycosyltransferase family 2 protein n=1 Tax=Shewanella sp. MEBiC00475 TaxID=2575361 RepID=UPI0010C0453F|nr:glycosyltransferase family 2 protein [Shewanella sp. MEBiC00475]
MSLTPKAWVSWAKNNPKLVAAYSRNLHKSGLLYQLQTMEELTRSYTAYQKYQQQSVAELLVTAKFSSQPANPLTLLICVPTHNADSLLATLISVDDQQALFSEVLVWCHTQDVASVRAVLNDQLDSTFTLITNLGDVSCNTTNTPCFMIFAGDVIESYLRELLPSVLPQATNIAYVDTDVRDAAGNRNFPDFKPDWNPDLQLTAGYVSSGVWIDKLSRVEAVVRGPLPLTPFFISQFLCLCYVNGHDDHIGHIPLVLLSRPEGLAPFSQAASLLTDTYQSFADIIPSSLPTLSLRWKLQASPLVSIIIPTRNGMALVKACIDSILHNTTYSHYEILLINNSSDDINCINYFAELDKHPKIRVINYDKAFNYSAINNFAAKHAKGDVLALVNNDIEVISPNWLQDMVSHVLREDIGCVGAKLLFSDDRIQHAGVVMGYGGGAGHAHKYFPADHYGYMNRLIATHNYSAVTAACLLITAKDFWDVGGLNEQDLAIAFNDVDLCLKVLQLGRRNLYCAESVLYHHESVSRGHEDTPEKVLRFKGELSYLQSNWQHVICADPAYNPNLTLRRENFGIKDVSLDG